MEIRLSNCTIRNWQVGDEESLVKHANDPEICRNLADQFPHPYTRQDADYWIRNCLDSSPSCNFAIEVDGAAVGGIGFTLQKGVHRKSAEIGYWLGRQYHRRGIMLKALRAVTEYAFETHDLCRVYARVFERNEASQGVLAKAGFEREACLKKAVIKEGQVLDEFIYAQVR